MLHSRRRWRRRFAASDRETSTRHACLSLVVERRSEVERQGARRYGRSDDDCYVSAASVWEISIKTELGKREFEGDPVKEIWANGFVELPMTAQHASHAGRLPRHHDDPFDRMLIAQAKLEHLQLVSRDAAFKSYAVSFLRA